MQYIEDITRVVISYEIYQMTTSVIFCLSFDLSTELFIAFKVDNDFNEKCIVVTDVVMTLLVPAESVNARVVITLFMT